MKASDVIQFLQANPAFFDDNSTLLTELTVTHPTRARPSPSPSGS
jgi:uncharacterized protein YigA (DUF484 family)